MGNLTVSTPVDTFMQATTQAEMLHAVVPFATIDTTNDILKVSGTVSLPGNNGAPDAIITTGVPDSITAQGNSEVLICSGAEASNVLAIQNPTAGGFCAISIRDINSGPSFAIGHGNPGNYPYLSGNNFIENSNLVDTSGQAPPLRITFTQLNASRQSINGVPGFAVWQPAWEFSTVGNSSFIPLTVNIGNGDHGEIDMPDQNFSIVGRENGVANSYYCYGDTLANGGGHRFWVGGVKSNQNCVLQLATDEAQFKIDVGFYGHTIKDIGAIVTAANGGAYDNPFLNFTITGSGMFWPGAGQMAVGAFNGTASYRTCLDGYNGILFSEANWASPGVTRTNLTFEIPTALRQYTLKDAPTTTALNVCAALELSTSGDSSSGFAGMTQINYADKTVKIWVAGLANKWVQIGSWT